MNPDEYYNIPYGYTYNYTSYSGWFIIIVLLILIAIFLKLGSDSTDSIAEDSCTTCNTEGLAEYWYSDSPGQAASSSDGCFNRSHIYSTPVIDKKRTARNKI